MFIMEFEYKGVDAAGKSVNGSLDAVDRKQVIKKLRLQKIKPIEIKVSKGKGRGKLQAKVDKADVKEQLDTPGTKASSGSVMGRFQKGEKLALPFFTKLLQLHKSGMPLGDAVSLMSQRMSSAALTELAAQLYKDLSEGRTLATAMRQVPDVFDPTLGHLIEAGEATGNLAPILENIIENLEQRAELKKKVMSAMAYPMLIGMVALGVVALFLFFLLPRIRTMMESMDGELNMIAKLMIWVSEFSLQEGPFVFAGLLAAVIAYFQWRKTEKGRIITDRWILKVPMLSSIYYNADICRITNIMGILLGNGVNTTESLRLAENTVQNRSLLARFQAARTLINDGAPFSASFKRFALFSDMDIDILNIGENTGSVVASFKELYRTHAIELESKLKLSTNLLAGGALFFTFVMVFLLTLGIVTSILDLSKTMMAQ